MRFRPFPGRNVPTVGELTNNYVLATDAFCLSRFNEAESGSGNRFQAEMSAVRIIGFQLVARPSEMQIGSATRRIPK